MGKIKILLDDLHHEHEDELITYMLKDMLEYEVENNATIGR